ncbi:MAG: N-acetylmuramoyl-L-alanine amidase [Bacteroidetes bacterium]|nr:N-acetylmuramoyl-L-alanine amidase [Bacteroidota bacterium]
MKRGCFFALTVFFSGITVASPDRDTAAVWKLQVRINATSGQASLPIASPGIFNAVAIKLPSGALQSGNWTCAAGKRHTTLTRDEHAPNTSSDLSNLWVLSQPDSLLSLEYRGQPLTAEITAIFLWVPPLSETQHMSAEKRADCSAPGLISQSVWRSGLPAPVPGRSATPTHHCIIHHSGENNGDTNYTQIVRSYYTYHTTVNGWDDIGYNYLVAANGTVYAGRDPEKAGIRQDNVLGAHFCGKNNFTMGVCVIGNFSSAQPDSLAIQSLEKLLAWKIHQDTLNPYGQFKHPDNAGSWLDVIAGHRQGCATECPGDKLFARIPAIRDAIAPCALVTAVYTGSNNQQPQLKWTQGHLKLLNSDTPLQAELTDPAGRLLWKGRVAASPQLVPLAGPVIYRLSVTPSLVLSGWLIPE